MSNFDDFQFEGPGAGATQDIDGLISEVAQRLNERELFRYANGTDNFDENNGTMYSEWELVDIDRYEGSWRSAPGGRELYEVAKIIVNNVPVEYRNNELLDYDLRPFLFRIANDQQYGDSVRQMAGRAGALANENLIGYVQHNIYSDEDELSPTRGGWQYLTGLQVLEVANQIAETPLNTNTVKKTTSIAQKYYEAEVGGTPIFYDFVMGQNLAGTAVGEYAATWPKYVREMWQAETNTADGTSDEQPPNEETENETENGGATRAEAAENIGSDYSFWTQSTGPVANQIVRRTWNRSDLQALARVAPDSVWNSALEYAASPQRLFTQDGADEKQSADYFFSQFKFEPSSLKPDMGPYNVDPNMNVAPTVNLLGMINLPYQMNETQMMALHDNLMLAGYYQQVDAFPLVKGDPSDGAFNLAYRAFLTDVMQTGNTLEIQLQTKQRQYADMLRTQLDKVEQSDIELLANQFSQSVLGRDLTYAEQQQIVRAVEDLDIQETILSESTVQRELLSGIRAGVEQIDPEQQQQFAGFQQQADWGRFYARRSQEQQAGFSQERLSADELERELTNAMESGDLSE